MSNNTSNIEVEVRVDELFGTKQWFIKGSDIRHREDGPAVEYTCGGKEWWLNNELHLVELSSGNKFWYINGSELSDEKIAEHASKLKAETEAKKLKAEKLSAMDEDDIFMIMALGAS
ncbi:hypothetical protein M3914_003145 [Vibrio metschnikovii]|nr:hypothetical protein [Vibrio metschnikovii]